MTDRLLGMIGMAKRAGKTIVGETSYRRAIKEGKAKLVVIAADAADGTKKTVGDSCRYYKVPIIICETKRQLGIGIGGSETAVIAVSDNNFAKAISDIYKKSSIIE